MSRTLIGSNSLQISRIIPTASPWYGDPSSGGDTSLCQGAQGRLFQTPHVRNGKGFLDIRKHKWQRSVVTYERDFTFSYRIGRYVQSFGDIRLLITSNGTKGIITSYAITIADDQGPSNEFSFSR